MISLSSNSSIISNITGLMTLVLGSSNNVTWSLNYIPSLFLYLCDEHLSMDKIITRIPKLKGRQLKAYNYELTKNSNEDDISLPNNLNDNKSNSLDTGNEPESTIESYEMSFVDTNQEKLDKKDAININQALIIENYTEVLIQKLLTQKLRLLDSNDSNLPYYYHGGA